MTGFSTLTKIESVKNRCEEIGFKMVPSGSLDTICIQPKTNDSLPIYHENSPIFVGTLEEIDIWLSGVCWARYYDSMVTNNKSTNNRKKAEKNISNKRLIKIIKESDISDL